jgi:hypothetical protein
MSYWPLVTIVAALGLVAKGYVLSDSLRGIISLLCVGLAVYQWTIYRKRRRFSLPGLVLLALAMVSIWLALNVLRDFRVDRRCLPMWNKSPKLSYLLMHRLLYG